jgi:xanthine dehydrogenase YagS FAD-binding subunit
VNPFSYSRATDWQAAVHDIAGDARAKFLGGGTNLVDLMKMGVENTRPSDRHQRLPLAQVEELPNDAGVRIGALVRNSDLARASAR